MTTLIPKQTAALTVKQNIGKESVPCTIAVDGDMAANTITFNQVGINGTDVTGLFAGGSAVVLSATITSIEIEAPCRLQIVKGITTNAVGVILVS